jgi:hypothetical protein
MYNSNLNMFTFYVKTDFLCYWIVTHNALKINCVQIFNEHELQLYYLHIKIKTSAKILIPIIF